MASCAKVGSEEDFSIACESKVCVRVTFAFA